MIKTPYWAFICLIFLFVACHYDNVYDRYFEGGDTLVPVPEKGMLALLSLDGSLANQSNTGVSVSIPGTLEYISGVDGKDSSALHLSGYPQCITLSNLGMIDTLSVFFWFRADEPYTGDYPPTLFDYGVSGLTVRIDGVSGQTLLTSAQKSTSYTTQNWVNTYNTWNFLYAEAGADTLRIMYRGSLLNGEAIEVDEKMASPGSLDPLTDILYIGRSANGEAYQRSYFTGGIDNVRIFSRPLSRAELLSLINEDTAN